MNERIKINVILADRHYPMSVFPFEEAAIRKAVKEIGNNLKEIESKYDVQDKQDALSMCLLQYVSQIKIKTINKEKEEKEIETNLGNIINKIDQCFQQN